MLTVGFRRGFCARCSGFMRQSTPSTVLRRALAAFQGSSRRSQSPPHNGSGTLVQQTIVPTNAAIAASARTARHSKSTSLMCGFPVSGTGGKCAISPNSTILAPFPAGATRKPSRALRNPTIWNSLFCSKPRSDAHDRYDVQGFESDLRKQKNNNSRSSKQGDVAGKSRPGDGLTCSTSPSRPVQEPATVHFDENTSSRSGHCGRVLIRFISRQLAKESVGAIDKYLFVPT
jgi:hypothetical protein